MKQLDAMKESYELPDTNPAQTHMHSSTVCVDLLSNETSRYIDRYLSNLFLQIGIPANQQGFRFLNEAVKLVLKEPTLEHRLMHGLYPRLAEHFHTSVYCVEHSMRCAITAAWNRGRPELVEKLLGRGVITAYDKPTNGELISLVAENARLLINDQFTE